MTVFVGVRDWGGLDVGELRVTGGFITSVGHRLTLIITKRGICHKCTFSFSAAMKDLGVASDETEQFEAYWQKTYKKQLRGQQMRK